MSIRSIEYDHLTGLKTTTGFEDDKMKIRYEQDTEATFERLKRLRESPEYAKQGIKENFQHLMHIPDSVCMKMMVEDGINPYNCDPKELHKHVLRNKDKYGMCLVSR